MGLIILYPCAVALLIIILFVLEHVSHCVFRVSYIEQLEMELFL